MKKDKAYLIYFEVYHGIWEERDTENVFVAHEKRSAEKIVKRFKNWRKKLLNRDESKYPYTSSYIDKDPPPFGKNSELIKKAESPDFYVHIEELDSITLYTKIVTAKRRKTK